MTVKPIPNEHHILRWVRNRSLARDATGAVVGIFGDAFTLRAEEDYLSALWCEFHRGSPNQQVAAAIAEFKAAVSVGKKDRFAKGQVSTLKAATAEFGMAIRITHEPEPNIACHAAVRRFKDDRSELLDVLAELHPVSWTPR